MTTKYKYNPEWSRKWYAANREKRLEACKRYYQANKDKKREYDKLYNKKNKAKISKRRKHSHLMKRYGISKEDYNLMFERQGGACAICGKHQNSLEKALSVDHDHNSKKVRALLCPGCNKGLGHFLDSFELLMKAADYLRGHKHGR